LEALGLFQRRIWAKHVKANVDVAIMRKGLDVQIMRVIDVLADLEHHRQRMRGPEVRTDHIGQVLADGIGDSA
jgi:hypothetical protein